jgi:hypothetical protein
MRAEVRGRGDNWRVLTTDASDIATPVPVFDKEGVQTDVLWCGAPTGKMIESYFPGGSLEEAKEYATYLGATEIQVTKTNTPTEALALARKAKEAE